MRIGYDTIFWNYKRNFSKQVNLCCIKILAYRCPLWTKPTTNNCACSAARHPLPNVYRFCGHLFRSRKFFDKIKRFMRRIARNNFRFVRTRDISGIYAVEKKHRPSFSKLGRCFSISDGLFACLFILRSPLCSCCRPLSFFCFLPTVCVSCHR